MKSFLTAGFALATCAAFAALQEQVFDGLADGSITAEGNWKGGVVEPKTTGSSDKVLAIDGTVSCSNAVGAASSEFVKTSFKVLAPADATATTDLPTGTELEDCQIAIATGPYATETETTLKVMVYRGGDSPAWTETGLTVATGAWFTVTLHFDYTAKTAKVEIGGAYSDPVALVTKPESNVNVAKINSLSFVGSSKIDNVSIAEAIAQNSLASTLQGFELYESELPSGVAGNLNTGNNYTEHIEAGLTPVDETLVFNATALSTDSTETVITVPCNKDYGQVYQIVINNGADQYLRTVAAEAGPIDTVSGSRALKFEVPSDLTSKVLKFQVKVGALAPLNS